jgi:Yip1 domain
MSEVQSPAAEGAGLTQLQRVTSTFTAPSKTFQDIKRGNRSWWLPLIVLAVFSYIFFAVVSQKVGMQQVMDNQIHMNPKAQEQMAAATPEQRAKANGFWLGFTQGMFLAGPLVGLAGAAIVSLGLLGTINFVFGGRANYGQIFAVSYYAWLPSIVKVMLGIVVLYAGMAPESFNIKNFSPTNAAALFMDPTSSNKALYALASSFDIVTLWVLVLMGMGIATVAGVKRSSGYIAVFSWWILFVLIGAGWAAAFS